jgi:hypothetical protein
VLSWGKDKPRSTAPLLIGLRDRALVGVMVYAFARINAVLQIKVSDYFAQGRRGWVRLHENRESTPNIGENATPDN